MATPKSILLISGASLALVFGLYLSWKAIAPTEENDHVAHNFPHAFMALADAGHIDAVKVWRGRVPPATVELDGVECFPAWRCNNALCTGRTGETPYVFAHDSSKGPSAICSLCLVAMQKAPEAKRGAFDPSNTTTYYTEEAEAVIKTIQAAAH